MTSKPEFPLEPIDSGKSRDDNIFLKRSTSHINTYQIVLRSRAEISFVRVVQDLILMNSLLLLVENNKILTI